VGDFTKYITAFNNILKDDRIYRIALTTVLTRHKTRIFQNGLDGNNAKVGTYDTKAASIKGKRYPGGYAEYKAAKGRNPGYVIFRDTDQMYVDYGLIVGKPSKEYGFDHQNKLNFDKTQWMETKYATKIWVATDQEKQLFTRIVELETKKLHG